MCLQFSNRVYLNLAALFACYCVLHTEAVVEEVEIYVQINAVEYHHSHKTGGHGCYHTYQR